MSGTSISLTFVISAGNDFGLGHARRTQSIAEAFRLTRNLGELHVILRGIDDIRDLWPQVPDASFQKLVFDGCLETSNKFFGRKASHDFLIFDLHPDHIDEELRAWAQVQKVHNYLIGIDSIALRTDWPLDLRWMPTFYRDPDWPPELNIQHGWNSFLMTRRDVGHQNKCDITKLLVLTGGADPLRLSSLWPPLLERIETPDSLEITWVIGPFSRKPSFTGVSNHLIRVVDSPESIHELIYESDLVVSLYGVSVYESLMYGKKVISYCPSQTAETEALAGSGLSFVFYDPRQALNHVVTALAAPSQPSCIDGLGPQRILTKMFDLIE